jgi:transposase-like protein
MGEAADNGRMRSRQEIRGIVESYAESGMTRREYCKKYHIPITTLDYWRRTEKGKLKLVEIAEEPQPSAGFTLVLANGRRVESSWRFAEADLLRLIRVAEA